MGYKTALHFVSTELWDTSANCVLLQNSYFETKVKVVWLENGCFVSSAEVVRFENGCFCRFDFSVEIRLVFSYLKFIFGITENHKDYFLDINIFGKIKN